ncbi:hypothetical protein NN4_65130 [Nocardia ninae NBRC 108245]|uniref:Uncharacterized protein n=2 Tax=Nocardia ninae TaxID=356145 RepID=A0A511MMZ0_9NOCA|nr:hypothetical protein NN4_65130 [Nocardia ninae NBRC 108245]
MNLENVRDQLLDAAAFGKYLPPEQLEHAAGKIAEALRVFRMLTPEQPATPSASGAPRHTPSCQRGNPTP